MYERNETKTTTNADGASFDYKITEKSSSGLSQVLLIPIGITLSAVACSLIIKVGVTLENVVNKFNAPAPSAYMVRETLR